jgi:hypothetical protein
LSAGAFRQRDGLAPERGAASNGLVRRKSTLREFVLLVAAACACGFAPAPAAAQAPIGPIEPPKPPKIVRIPTNPASEKPPLPAAEIIQRFAEREDEYARAREGYIYHKRVLLEELGANGKPSGAGEVSYEYGRGTDGQWHPKMTRGRDSTLQLADLDPDALDMLSRIPSFPLVTSELSKYKLTYLTVEPVDQLTTYVFRVTPVQLDRTHAYFSGLIWVDNHDLAIVKSYGKWVSETGDMTTPGLPFTMFTTYRQPVSDKYWMPAYCSSEGSVPGPNGSVPVRLVIVWDHYTPIAASVHTTAAAPAASPPAPAR